MLVRVDWWKTSSIARTGECLTGKRATHTQVCATVEFPRCAYFAVTLFYLLPEIVITSKACHQVFSCGWKGLGGCAENVLFSIAYIKYCMSCILC